jgi:uncharacterized membrane-anchored protein
MDWGLDFLNMFEKHFGAFWTRLLVLLVALAVAGLALKTIYQYLLKPVFETSQSILPYFKDFSFPSIPANTLPAVISGIISGLVLVFAYYFISNAILYFFLRFNLREIKEIEASAKGYLETVRQERDAILIKVEKTDAEAKAIIELFERARNKKTKRR